MKLFLLSQSCVSEALVSESQQILWQAPIPPKRKPAMPKWRATLRLLKATFRCSKSSLARALPAETSPADMIQRLAALARYARASFGTM